MFCANARARECVCVCVCVFCVCVHRLNIQVDGNLDEFYCLARLMLKRFRRPVRDLQKVVYGPCNEREINGKTLRDNMQWDCFWITLVRRMIGALRQWYFYSWMSWHSDNTILFFISTLFSFVWKWKNSETRLKILCNVETFGRGTNAYAHTAIIRTSIIGNNNGEQ